MAAAFNAALLDELMGRNRNATTGDEVRLPHWSDEDVCRYFLCGFCPYDLFTNTRADLGICDKNHDEKLRDAYEKSSRYQKVGYEDQFCRYLRTVVADVERRIRRGQERIKLSNAPNSTGGNSPAREERLGRMEELVTKINSLVEEAERLGCEGNVEKSQNLMRECDILQRERERLNQIEQGVSQQNKELEVCDICGAFRIKDDAPSRQEEHLTGKMHLGYARIRNYMKEWEDKQEELRRKRTSTKDRERPPSQSHSSREHDPEREKATSKPSVERDSLKDNRDGRKRNNSHHTRSRSRDRNRSERNNGGHHSSDKKRRDRSRDRNSGSRRRSREKRNDHRGYHRSRSNERNRRDQR